MNFLQNTELIIRTYTKTIDHPNVCFRLYNMHGIVFITNAPCTLVPMGFCILQQKMLKLVARFTSIKLSLIIL